MGWGSIAQCLSALGPSYFLGAGNCPSHVATSGFNRALNRNTVTKSTPRNDLVLSGGQSHLWLGTTGLVLEFKVVCLSTDTLVASHPNAFAFTLRETEESAGTVRVGCHR